MKFYWPLQVRCHCHMWAAGKTIHLRIKWPTENVILLCARMKQLMISKWKLLLLETRNWENNLSALHYKWTKNNTYTVTVFGDNQFSNMRYGLQRYGSLMTDYLGVLFTTMIHILHIIFFFFNLSNLTVLNVFEILCKIIQVIVKCPYRWLIHAVL